MENVKGLIIWFKGEQVRLSGESKVLHGGLFYDGVYVTGYQVCESVTIAESIVKLYHKNNKQVKLTDFESQNVQYKIEVLIDSGLEMWNDINFTRQELDSLCDKIKKGIVILNQKEYDLVREESQNLLDIANDNYYSGYPEYKTDVIKLRKLIKKLSLALTEE